MRNAQTLLRFFSIFVVVGCRIVKGVGGGEFVWCVSFGVNAIVKEFRRQVVGFT
jgi:hypothetical protein